MLSWATSGLSPLYFCQPRKPLKDGWQHRTVHGFVENLALFFAGVAHCVVYGHFPTEDDRHDVATIMLFQAYTGGRLAEFAHVLKGKVSQDPLGNTEEVESDRRD